VEPSSITSALLPTGTAPDSFKRLTELSDEELALRHRLEPKVERALYRAAAALQELGHHMATHSHSIQWNIIGVVTQRSKNFSKRPQ